MYGREAKGVVEGGRIVDLEGEEAVGAERLEELRGVAQGDGILRLGAPILARVGEIRHYSGHRGRAVILETSDEVQQAHQPVVDARARASV